jgi:hypothetical protein
MADAVMTTNVPTAAAVVQASSVIEDELDWGWASPPLRSAGEVEVRGADAAYSLIAHRDAQPRRDLHCFDGRSVFMRGSTVVLAALLLALTCTFATMPSSANGYVTAVKVFSPFEGPRLAKNLTVASTVSGSCWTGSIAMSGRSDAWRCMVGNDISDPCYVGQLSNAHVAVCAGPFSSRAIVIKLTAPLSSSDANQPTGTRDDPSALELGDGARCEMITGATNAIGGMRLNYGCSGDEESVYGDPDRTTSPWRVHVLSTGGSKMRLVNVRVAWF